MNKSTNFHSPFEFPRLYKHTAQGSKRYAEKIFKLSTLQTSKVMIHMIPHSTWTSTTTTLAVIADRSAPGTQRGHGTQLMINRK